MLQITLLWSASIIVFLFCFWLAFKSKVSTAQGLADEEVEHLKRVNALLEGVNLHNGREWATLSVDEIVDVLLFGVEILSRRDTTKKILVEMATKCTDMADWIEESQVKMQVSSGISHIVKKPREVAVRLLEIACKA